MEQFALEFELTPERRIFSVAELTAAVRALLSGEFTDIWVSGEIFGLKLATSGHYYFTLKDRDAQLRAVAFRSTHRFWKFKPQDGLAVLARGRIDVFESRGEYQLQVEMLEPQGLGALQLAFEQLKKRLAAEGLFAAGRKRALPPFPRRIGIVTSARGAVKCSSDGTHVVLHYSGLVPKGVYTVWTVIFNGPFPAGSATNPHRHPQCRYRLPPSES